MIYAISIILLGEILYTLVKYFPVKQTPNLCEIQLLHRFILLLFKNKNKTITSKIIYFHLWIRMFCFMYICKPCEFLVPEKPAESARSPGNGGIAQGCLEWNQHPLREQQAKCSSEQLSHLSSASTVTFQVILFYMSPLLNGPSSFTSVLVYPWQHILGLLFWSSFMVPKIKTRAWGKPGGYSPTEPYPQPHN